MREKLKNIRNKHSFTQEQVACKLGIKRATYTNIELGNKKPSLDLAFKIKQIFNYQSDDIFLNL